MTFRLLTVILIVLLSLTACGQTGDLYLTNKQFSEHTAHSNS